MVPDQTAASADPDYRSLFIGDHAENGAIVKEVLGQQVDDHIGWPQNYMPGDRAGIAVHDKTLPAYDTPQSRTGGSRGEALAASTKRGIVCVVPGRLTIAAFSPMLDQFGNSVRAQAAITQIAAELRLNLYLP